MSWARLPVAADSPWYLALLVLVPLVWYFSYHSLASLGRVRRIAVLLLRSSVLVLLVLAAAELQWVRRNDRLTVIYLVDQSLSIPQARRAAMFDYVRAAVAKYRPPEDRAGVIVFGREANIEIPPFDEDLELASASESLLDPEYTNLAGAIKLAQASFTEDSAKRIVIVSDGNENIGDGLEQARLAAAAGISIDVVPISYHVRSEVAVEKLALQTDIRNGQPFDMRVVLNNMNQATADDPGIVRGRLIVSERTEDQPIVLSDEHIELPPGKHVLTLRQKIERPNFYSYEARFVPDDPADDAMVQNNRATAFTHVRGSGQVLLIEDEDHRGDHALLVDKLQQDNLEVTIQSTSRLFGSLAELQPFDTIILADVPHDRFSDEQVAMLARNTHDLGGGLVMLGGPNSFGAGGWNNTEVEAAMPLDFQIKSAKVQAKGALAMVMHASEMPEGNHWQKVIVQEAIKALGSEDYCGVLHWNGTERWLWGGGLIPVRQQRDNMMAAVDRMLPGDMPDFDPAMVQAQRGFAALKDAAVKHMVVISDGDPVPPTAGVINGLKALNVTVSTVAVGCHGPAQSVVLKNLANATGGKYYEVRDARALPKIFQREARRVARPLIFEDANGFRPQLKFSHEMTSGIGDALPPLTGYVMTSVKENPLVEVSIVSPVPDVAGNTTILASWTYGLGKAVAFTSDTGARWAGAWTNWPNYGKLFSQAIRWSMRPVDDPGKLTVTTDVAEGKVSVIVTALDKSDNFLNFLDLRGAVIGPDMKSGNIQLKQTAPGRYIGEFPAQDAGSYFLMLTPGAGKGAVRTGVNVPYSAEFRDREANETLLSSLAAIEPKGGRAGELIRAAQDSADQAALLEVNSFRHDLAPAESTEDAWPTLLLLAGCLFFADTFTRRVSVDLSWLAPLAVRVRDRLLRRQQQPVKIQYIERLRSRKAEISQSLEQRRGAARFEPPPETTAPTAPLDVATLEPTAPKPAPPKSEGLAPPKKEEEDYTSRLLKAKQKVWEDRDKKKDGPS